MTNKKPNTTALAAALVRGGKMRLDVSREERGFMVCTVALLDRRLFALLHDDLHWRGFCASAHGKQNADAARLTARRYVGRSIATMKPWQQHAIKQPFAPVPEKADDDFARDERDRIRAEYEGLFCAPDVL